ncbi:hypothetical protein ABIE53_004974 [Burkholderia sp. OAS925]
MYFCASLQDTQTTGSFSVCLKPGFCQSAFASLTQVFPLKISQPLPWESSLFCENGKLTPGYSKVRHGKRSHVLFMARYFVPIHDFIFIFHAPKFFFGRAHHVIAGGKYNHFRAAIAVAEMIKLPNPGHTPIGHRGNRQQ